MRNCLLIFLVLFLFVNSIHAQKGNRKFSAGFGIEAGLPTGATADLYSLAIGITARFSYRVGPGFVTLTTGALGFDPKSVVVGQTKKVGLQIPVRAGYKYCIKNFFLMGEMGYSQFKSYYGQSGSLVSSTAGTFLAAPAVGFQYHAFELGLRYEVDFGSSASGLLAVRTGFNF